jgi:hypothetical protein
VHQWKVGPDECFGRRWGHIGARGLIVASGVIGGGCG